MKVSELIEKLSDLDPEMVIIVSTDEEGNSFNPLHDVEVSMSHQDQWGSIEPLHPDDVDSYDEGDLHPCVVIWP